MNTQPSTTKMQTLELERELTATMVAAYQVMDAIRIGTRLINNDLKAVTEQRDRLAEVLRNIRAGYGGQITDPDCGCDDCEFLIQIDTALQSLTPNVKVSAPARKEGL